MLESSESPDGFSPDDSIDAWPLCPDCGRRRLTTCPFCKTSGSDCLPGTGPDQRQAEHPLVICPVCDEPFEPAYLKTCEWCGHEFDDGIAVKPPPSVEPIEINERMVLLMIGIVAVMGGAIAYFAWLLRG